MKRLKNLMSDTEALILFGVIVIATILVASIVNRFFLRRLAKRKIEQKIDMTSFLFLKHLIVLTIYFVGVGWGLLILPITKGFAHTLLAGAGATTLILGLASQQILSNLMGGIFIILNKSFKINDVIEIQANKGKVTEINWHDTIIENENKDTIIIPNSLISNGLYKKIRKE